MAQDIRQYVRKSLAQGFTPETIRAVLRKYPTWNDIEDEVESELAAVATEADRARIGSYLLKLVAVLAVILVVALAYYTIQNRSVASSTRTATGPDVSTASAPTGAVTCDEYCGKVSSACTGSLAQYPSERDCLTYCSTNAKFALGKRGDPSGNTIACRTYHAGVAATTDSGIHCPHAGPSGGGICGTYCDNYCQLSLKTCAGKPFTTQADCLSRCAQVSQSGKPGDTSGDSIQCRIYHLGVAGTDSTAAGIHCPHGAPDGGGVCVGAVPQPVTAVTPAAPVVQSPTPSASTSGPKCPDYCTTMQSACVGANQQYIDISACLSSCAGFRLGTPGDTSGDSLSCRAYHAQVATTVDPTLHCPHAGLTGGGICADTTSTSTTPASTTPVAPSTTQSSSGSSPAASTPPSQAVAIRQFTFVPSEITVPIGTTITWNNEDNAPHTVTSGDGELNSPTMNQGDRFSHTFTKPGTYSYFCAIHPTMTGQVIVK